MTTETTTIADQIPTTRSEFVDHLSATLSALNDHSVLLHDSLMSETLSEAEEAQLRVELDAVLDAQQAAWSAIERYSGELATAWLIPFEADC